IPGVVEAIRGIRRVLKSNGKLVFFEHGLSSDPEVQRWQRLCEPTNRLVFGGCRLTRDIPSLLVQGGFHIEQMDTAYLVQFPKALDASLVGNGDSEMTIRPVCLQGASSFDK